MKLCDLRPHPQNPRTHAEPGSPKWEVLAKSLRHDYFDPMVWNEANGYLVSGHFRRKVLMAENFDEADVSVVNYDEETHIARMVAANRLLGEFDESLGDLCRELETGNLDAALAGFTETELAAMVEPPNSGDDEHAATLVSQAEALQEKWKVVEGDRYQIGNHVLICGDCTLLPEILGTPADLIWIDPPYNIDYGEVEQARDRWKGKESVSRSLLNDKMPDADYAVVLQEWLETAAKITKPGGAIYVAHAEQQGLPTRMAMLAAGWEIKQCLIWAKNGFTLGRQDYQWQHEPILYGWKPGAGHYWQGGFSQSTIQELGNRLNDLDKSELRSLVNELLNDRDGTVIRERHDSIEADHPTIKPQRLVARHIWNSTRRGETVVDLFSGSGTTLMAAEATGRRCVTTELDPKYCAVTLQRAVDFGLSIAKDE